MIYQKPNPGQPPVNPKSGSNSVVTVIVVSVAMLGIFLTLFGFFASIENGRKQEVARKQAEAREKAEKERARAEQKLKADADWLVTLAKTRAELNGYAAIDASQGPYAVEWDRLGVTSGTKSKNSEFVVVWTQKTGKALIAGSMMRVRGYAEVQCWVPKTKDDKIVCLPLEASVKGI